MSRYLRLFLITDFLCLLKRRVTAAAAATAAAASFLGGFVIMIAGIEPGGENI